MIKRNEPDTKKASGQEVLYRGLVGSDRYGLSSRLGARHRATMDMTAQADSSSVAITDFDKRRLRRR
jgi:hypothetical protein